MADQEGDDHYFVIREGDTYYGVRAVKIYKSPTDPEQQRESQEAYSWAGKLIPDAGALDAVRISTDEAGQSSMSGGHGHDGNGNGG